MQGIKSQSARRQLWVFRKAMLSLIMAIDGLIAEKSKIMEELLRLTAHMHQALSANQTEQFENFLELRGKAFDQLLRCDAQLKGVATPQDELWIRQLKMIETNDGEVVQFIQQMRQDFVNEETLAKREKGDLLQANMTDPRGNRIQVRG